MDAFLGEIRLMGFLYAPKGWLFCQGQLLQISTNQALFSLLGTMYGGDGRTTFALPDLRGRVALGAGQGPGLAPYVQGQRGGTETVTLATAEMPKHEHTFTGTIKTADAAEFPQISQSYPATGTVTQFATGKPNISLASGSLPGTLSSMGGSQGHDNRQPMAVMNYAIAIQGYFPSRG
ncbi:phage tail protein [Microvirga sp. STR05]|uniref:Phage tail protein n=1 Tax=Hymenobacter duratus TaxID=2771356 RepID=A0ABR8JC51_9BACT|nr:tail fiber protein [Hymenobacter duratus]MBD2714349.1 phage tail protein [Hymenobacter duratus]MBR7949252.1 phage tail protein [Microvirga sp. STR05]